MKTRRRASLCSTWACWCTTHSTTTSWRHSEHPVIPPPLKKHNHTPNGNAAAVAQLQRQTCRTWALAEQFVAACGSGSPTKIWLPHSCRLTANTTTQCLTSLQAGSPLRPIETHNPTKPTCPYSTQLTLVLQRKCEASVAACVLPHGNDTHLHTSAPAAVQQQCNAHADRAFVYKPGAERTCRHSCV